MKHPIPLIALSSFLLSGAAWAQQITNHEAPGNLQSTTSLICIDSGEVKNTYTPPDLYRAMASCIKQNDAKKAVFLYAIAGVYDRFDTQRVADKTAHDAGAISRMQTFSSLSDEQLATLKQAIQETTGNPKNFGNMCANIRRIGPPGYFPVYMIQHGMGAFTGEGKGLIPNFDAAATWKSSLDTYLHCPQN